MSLCADQDPVSERLSDADRLRLALDAGAVLGTWYWDLLTDRFTVDEGFAHNFGLDPALGRVGLSLEEVIATVHPDDVPGLRAAIDEVIQRGGRYAHQYRVRRADGRYYWIEANGRVDKNEQGHSSSFPGVLLDVDERRALVEERDRATRLLESFIEAVPGVVYAKDRQGRMLIANRGTTEVVGKPPSEYLGRTDAEFLNDPEQARAVMANDEQVMSSGETLIVEEHVNFAGGRRAVWLSTKAPMRDDNGEIIGLIGSSIDVTARRDAEVALALSEERLRFALDAAGGIGTWDWRLADDIVYASRRFAELYGLDPDRAEQGTSLAEYVAAIHPDDRERVSSAIRQTIDKDTPYRAEYRIVGRDGEVRWVVAGGQCYRDAEGRPERFPGAAFDITDRKRVEETLHQTSRRLDAILNNTRMAVFLMDDRQHCVYANAAAEVLTGYAFADMQGRPLHDVVHHKKPDGSHYPLEECPIDRAFPARAQMSGEELFVAPDGSFYPVGFTASPLLDEDGRPVGTVIEARNIADEKARDATLRELNEELERRVADEVEKRAKAEEALRQSQKMEAVGQLTGGVAHDFNNLLTVVTGNIDIASRSLAATGANEPRASRALENARKGAERATALTQRLLAFARRQPLAPKAIQVDRLVRDMADLLKRALGETVKLEVITSPGLWRVEADPNQLENAILNLAVNARDAMPDGGELVIETANAQLSEDYAREHAEVSPGQYVMIAVSDTGHGMAQETVLRVFEPFFTTKEVGKGTGLGLSQVYGFIKQSGGHVNLYSEEGQGTTVKLYLPRLMQEAEAADEERSLPEAPERSVAGETILVVEDDDDVRLYTVDCLRDLGYRVLEAHDGPSALTLLERQQEPVTLLFTDVVMPRMSGRELADLARRLHPHMKILYTSGYTRNAIVHGGRLDPGVELIAKPFTAVALAQKIRDVLDRGSTGRVLVVDQAPAAREKARVALRSAGYRVDGAADDVEALSLLRAARDRYDALVVDGSATFAQSLLEAVRLRASEMPVVFVHDNAGPEVSGRNVTILPKPLRADALVGAVRSAGRPIPKSNDEP